MNTRNGYVYILSNPSMPGLLKIGRSIHGGRSRAKDIYQTGVPTPFKLEFEIYAEDCVECEMLVHEELCNERVSESREFFRVEINDAVKTLVNVVCSSFCDIQAADQYEQEAIFSVRGLTDKVQMELLMVCSILNKIDATTFRSISEAVTPEKQEG